MGKVIMYQLNLDADEVLLLANALGIAEQAWVEECVKDADAEAWESENISFRILTDLRGIKSRLISVIGE